MLCLCFASPLLASVSCAAFDALCCHGYRVEIYTQNPLFRPVPFLPFSRSTFTRLVSVRGHRISNSEYRYIAQIPRPGTVSLLPSPSTTHFDSSTTDNGPHRENPVPHRALQARKTVRKAAGQAHDICVRCQLRERRVCLPLNRHHNVCCPDRGREAASDAAPEPTVPTAPPTLAPDPPGIGPTASYFHEYQFDPDTPETVVVSVHSQLPPSASGRRPSPAGRGHIEAAIDRTSASDSEPIETAGPEQEPLSQDIDTGTDLHHTFLAPPFPPTIGIP